MSHSDRETERRGPEGHHRDHQACIKFLGWGHLFMLEVAGKEPHVERMKILTKGPRLDGEISFRVKKEEEEEESFL